MCTFIGLSFSIVISPTILHCLSLIFHNYLHIFAVASFMTLDKRNCIIWIACCTLALVSLALRSFFVFLCALILCRLLLLLLLLWLSFLQTDLFAINSKRIFPWLFCLWSSVLPYPHPIHLLYYLVSRNRQWFVNRWKGYKEKVQVFFFQAHSQLIPISFHHSPQEPQQQQQENYLHRKMEKELFSRIFSISVYCITFYVCASSFKRWLFFNI